MELFKSDCNCEIPQTVGAIMEPIFSFKHQKMKESFITIAGNRGTPLTLKVLLAQT